jgi:hypothetical protein
MKIGHYMPVTVQSPTPRRLQPPSWLDLRLVLGLLLVAGSVFAGAIVVTRAQRTTRVLASARDLAVGTTLSAGDLDYVSVKLPHGNALRYLDERSDAVGKQLTRAVARGELLPAAAVRAVPARTTVSVPFAAGAAPSLRAGERIEIWLSTTSCPSVVLLPDVTVQAVHDAGSVVSDGGQDVVLSVPSRLADRVMRALATDGASIRAGVLTGTRPADADAPLPDLSGCRPGPSP